MFYLAIRHSDDFDIGDWYWQILGNLNEIITFTRDIPHIRITDVNGKQIMYVCCDNVEFFEFSYEFKNASKWKLVKEEIFLYNDNNELVYTIDWKLK